ncbi:hypothetical protein Slin15195_G018100 [Septoria linicola]|uniref:Uncharacterized protein n=1 Tax=Septoria linicola TaxID=215465 RepID=A0A9Q9APJ8_9PEZI|nr:hypothetical protein Slin14017_G018160 [Septoria linicola]USW48491.1 hypothetical protein Slin15195_G018100 [Septoria linicola]
MSGRTGSGSRRSDAGGVDKKAWASGRVLTSEQRQRKQEVDRKANRFLKKEVQDRLALLEARVLQLEGSSTNVDVKEVVRDASQRPVQASSTSPASTDVDGTVHSNLEPLPEAQHWSETIDYSNGTSSDPTARAAGMNSHDLGIANLAGSGSAGRGFAHPQLTAQFAAGGRPTAGGRELTMFLNHLVEHIRNIATDRVCYDDEHNQDVIINAVLKGWKFALSRYEQVCPLWEVLQMVDLCLFKDCNMVERISCLRMLHKRYMFETKNVAVQVEGPLPAWFQPHMAESLIAHEPVIDHLTWPKLRERLMSSQTDMLTNKFWAMFARNIRVAWQFEPFDIVAFSPKSSFYQLTHNFEAGLLDMANWRMDVNFFYEFPGLADDVPPANYMPLAQIAPRFGIAERMFLQQQQQQQQQQAINQQRRGTFPGEMPPRGLHISPVPDDGLYEAAGPVAWNQFYS